MENILLLADLELICCTNIDQDLLSGDVKKVIVSEKPIISRSWPKVQYTGG